MCFRSAQKGVRWMPRHDISMKDVAGCDKPRGGPKQPLIRGFPNGETHLDLIEILCTEYIGTWRRPGEVKHLSNQRKRKNKNTTDF